MQHCHVPFGIKDDKGVSGAATRHTAVSIGGDITTNEREGVLTISDVHHVLFLLGSIQRALESPSLYLALRGGLEVLIRLVEEALPAILGIIALNNGFHLVLIKLAKLGNDACCIQAARLQTFNLRSHRTVVLQGFVACCDGSIIAFLLGLHYGWVDAYNTAIGFVSSGGSVLCALLNVWLSWLIGKQVQLLGIGVHNRLLLLRAAHGVFIQDALKLAIRDAITLCNIVVQTLQRVVAIHHFLENVVLHGADLQHIGSNSLVRRVVNTLAFVIACLLHGFPH